MTREDFHEGDSIVITENPESVEAEIDWTEEMNKFKGGAFTIRKMFDIGCTLESCRINEHNLNPFYEQGYYLFAYEWIEPASSINFDEEEITCLFKET